MTTSPGKHSSLLSSSHNFNQIAFEGVMAPNNTPPASQALNQIRPDHANPQNKEGNRSTSSEYSIQRKFLENSTLHTYLAKKAPNLIKLEKRCYTLYEVGQWHIKKNFTRSYLSNIILFYYTITYMSFFVPFHRCC